ncbi:mCG144674, isoform CRA_b, partial [Mus musculus]
YRRFSSHRLAACHSWTPISFVSARILRVMVGLECLGPGCFWVFLEPQVLGQWQGMPLPPLVAGGSHSSSWRSGCWYVYLQEGNEVFSSLPSGVWPTHSPICQPGEI